MKNIIVIIVENILALIALLVVFGVIPNLIFIALTLGVAALPIALPTGYITYKLTGNKVITFMVSAISFIMLIVYIRGNRDSFITHTYLIATAVAWFGTLITHILSRHNNHIQ